MRIGVYFPQSEIGADLGAVRAYAQAAEDLGYDHLMTFDHVILADPKTLDSPRMHTASETLCEVFVLFGCLAGITRRIEMAVGVLILSQRQTALVARQAAAADVLSGGRVRLGVGIGWNEMEYEALGVPWQSRGARLEEQVALLRALWTNESVTFKGKWHTVTNGALNPLPVQRPIPIWFGGAADAMLRRAGRIGDGFLLLPGPNERGKDHMQKVRQAAVEAGRDPLKIGFDTRIHFGGEHALAKKPGRPYEQCAQEVERWIGLGATHATFNTRNSFLKSTDEHINAIRRFKEAVDPILKAAPVDPTSTV